MRRDINLQIKSDRGVFQYDFLDLPHCGWSHLALPVGLMKPAKPVRVPAPDLL
jgi:hypothetical protein